MPEAVLVSALRTPIGTARKGTLRDTSAFEAVCSGGLDVRPMLGQSVGLDEVPAALDASRDANGPARIVVAP